eukprot:6192443-Pleurochrysis_carterae.AAC.1
MSTQSAYFHSDEMRKIMAEIAAALEPQRILVRMHVHKASAHRVSCRLKAQERAASAAEAAAAGGQLGKQLALGDCVRLVRAGAIASGGGCAGGGARRWAAAMCAQLALVRCVPMYMYRYRYLRPRLWAWAWVPAFSSAFAFASASASAAACGSQWDRPAWKHALDTTYCMKRASRTTLG